MLRAIVFGVSCAAILAGEVLNRGFLVVHKQLTAPDTNDFLVQNEKAVITYTVLNIGEGCVELRLMSGSAGVEMTRLT